MDIGRASIVKSKVSIPSYFYNVVIPQMADYYDDYDANFENRSVVKCCLHDEETPSMRYYEETNTFFCFGCRAGGDVIELHRRFTESTAGVYPPFNEAVEFLYNYFIKGMESQTVITRTSSVEDKYLNKKTDVMRLSGYLGVLEKQLLLDAEISLEEKKSIWREIDKINELVSLNRADANEALRYMKSKVKEIIK